MGDLKGGITITDFQLVKSKVRIQDYIKACFPVNMIKENPSGELAIPCPIHKGTGFNFKTKGEIATCFSECAGEMFDVIDLHAKLNNMSKYESLNDLSIRYNVPLNKTKYIRNNNTNIQRVKAERIDDTIILEQVNLEGGNNIKDLINEGLYLKGLKEKVYGHFEFNEKCLIAHTVIRKGNKEESKEIVIYPGYIGILNSLVDLDEKQGVEYLRLVSYFHNVRKEILIPKSEITNENKMIETLNNTSGLIIKNRHKKYIVEYLEEQYEGFIANNLLKIKYMTKQVGFNDFRKSGLNIRTFIYPNHSFPIEPNFVFNPNEALNEVFIHSGSSDKWIKEVYKPVTGCRNGFISMVGVFASLLIEPLDVAESFIIDISGRSTTGKSTLLKALASVYGNAQRIIADFNSTYNSIISRAVQMKNFPVFLDDSKKADKSVIGDVIYTLSGGKEKGRSKIDGSLKKGSQFYSITFTNGEVPITEYLSQSNSNGRGAYGRLLPLEGGFLPNSIENSTITNRLQEKSSNYYGSIGYEWTKFIVSKFKHDVDKEVWKSIYRTFVNDNNEILTTDIARRRGIHVALLKTSYELMKVFNSELTCEHSEIYFNDLLKSIDENSTETDNYRLAHQILLEKFKEKSYLFNTYTDENESLKKIEILNNHEMWGDYKNGKYYVYSIETLQKLIENYGDTKDILNKWRECHVLETDSNRLNKLIRVRINGISKPERRYIIKEEYEH